MVRQTKATLLTSPRGFSPQGAIYDNEHERHPSGWGVQDFSAYPCLYKDIGFTFMMVLSSESGNLANVELIHPLEVLGVRKGSRELARLIAKRTRQRWAVATSPKTRPRTAPTNQA